MHRPSVTESEIKNDSNSEITHPTTEEPAEDSSHEVLEFAKEEEREVGGVKNIEEEAYVPPVVPHEVKEEHKPQYSAWDASKYVYTSQRNISG